MLQGGELVIEFIKMQAMRLRREDGQAMVEYGLILALVSVVAIAVLITVGGDVADVFTRIATDLEAALA
jgi:pilus assembly protein Flp/PilA